MQVSHISPNPIKPNHLCIRNSSLSWFEERREGFSDSRSSRLSLVVPNAPQLQYNWYVKTNGKDSGHQGEHSGPEEPDVSEKRFRTVIEQSPLSIHVFTPEGRSLLANSSWDELWYLGEEEEPEDRNIFEDEQLRATGLLPYVEKGVTGSTVTPLPLFYDPARTGRKGDPRWLQPEDTIARFSGDEFAILLEDVEDEAEVIEVANRVARGLGASRSSSTNTRCSSPPAPGSSWATTAKPARTGPKSCSGTPMSPCTGARRAVRTAMRFSKKRWAGTRLSAWGLSATSGGQWSVGEKSSWFTTSLRWSLRLAGSLV